MYKNNVELRVLVNGRPVREYSQKSLTFIESRHGTAYTIKIKNDNATKVMAVVSVDGLDVITGKSADKSDKGYIVDAYSSTEIKGYRTSDEKSVDFVFVSKDGDRNYTKIAEGGNKRNSGVIGIRVFEEKPEKVKVVEKHIHHHDNWYPKYPWNPYPIYPVNPYPCWYSSPTYTTCDATYRSNNNTLTLNSSVATLGGNLTTSGGAGGTGLSSSGVSALSQCGSSGQVYTKGLVTPDVSAKVVDNSSKSNDFDNAINYDAFDTGTGWGDEKTDVVRKEVFRKGKMLGELVLYYATSEALTNMGIDLNDVPKIAQMPKAFKNTEYCQPPKGWVAGQKINS